MPEQTTQERILLAAKEEFLRLGYQKSSLRAIVRAAGVTTGAFYGYYPDKAALFDALVREPAEGLYEIYLGAHEGFSALPPERQVSEMAETSHSGVWECFDYIYGHFDAFRLLLCCSEGTDWADYLDRLARIEAEGAVSFFLCLEKMGRPAVPVSDDLNHMLSSAYLSGFFEIIAHEMPREQARDYVLRLTDFFTAGWRSLLGF